MSREPAFACRSFRRTGTQDDPALSALPDGTVWYGDRRGNRVVRIAGNGAQEPIVPANGTTTALSGLALGTNGTVWFTKDSSHRIGWVMPDGRSREFASPESGAAPAGIVSDDAGGFWFYSRTRNYVGRVGSDGKTRIFRGPVASNSGFAPRGMARGADGALWLTERAHNAVYRFDTRTHHFRRFDIPTPRADPAGIVAAPNGDIWFAMNAVARVGRITPTGEIAEMDLPVTEFGAAGKTELRGIAATPDGSIWIASRSPYVARIAPDGSVWRFRCGEGLGTALVGPRGLPWFLANELVWEVVEAPRP